MSETRTPQLINHLPVVAFVRVDDMPGMLPDRHVVIVRDDHQGEGREYTCWLVAWQEGAGWVVAGSGRYCLSWDRALDVMITRARDTKWF